MFNYLINKVSNLIETSLSTLSLKVNTILTTSSYIISSYFLFQIIYNNISLQTISNIIITPYKFILFSEFTQLSLYYFIPKISNNFISNYEKFSNKPIKPVNISLIFFNLTFINLLMGYIVIKLLYFEIPNFLTLILELTKIMIVYDLAFYFLHRLAHTPFLYKHIHKIHHKHISPTMLSAVDSHPLEHFFVNLFPMILPCLIFNISSLSLLVFSTMGSLYTMNAHSGIKFINNGNHSEHHKVGNNNFGVLFTDKLFGTN